MALVGAMLAIVFAVRGDLLALPFAVLTAIAVHNAYRAALERKRAGA